MSLLTVRISIKDGSISYVLLSMDPDVRIEATEYEIRLNTTFAELSSKANCDVGECLLIGGRQRLEKTGRDLARKVLPDDVSKILSQSKDEYLYLDLEDGAVGFPWECIYLSDQFIGVKFKVGRHIRISDAGRGRAVSSTNKYVIIANPDGTLQDAALEGDDLQSRLSSVRKDLLKTSVSVNEACSAVAAADVLHFAGHSTPAGLRLSDGILTGEDIDSLPSVPRLVFLNSCGSGNLHDWSNQSLSIARSFLQAGTRVVIAATVPINSTQAAHVAGMFYEKIRDDSNVGKGMASATSGQDDDIAWARYIIYGHPQFSLSAKNLKKPNRRIFAWLSVIISLAVLLTIGYFYLARSTESFLVEERLNKFTCEKGNLASCYLLGDQLETRGLDASA